jgi:hypothetical protein
MYPFMNWLTRSVVYLVMFGAGSVATFILDPSHLSSITANIMLFASGVWTGVAMAEWKYGPHDY